VYTAKNVENKNWAITIYLENRGLKKSVSNTCDITDMNSGRELLSIKLHE
jgi:hypothetical protein